MNRLLHMPAVLALAALAWTTAQAQDAEGPPRQRADVVAELDAARSSGELAAMTGEDSGSFFLSQRAGTGGLSRLQVQAELTIARRNGELGLMHGEDSGSFALSGTLPAAALHYAGPTSGHEELSLADPALVLG
jgi:hypothetical protein